MKTAEAHSSICVDTERKQGDKTLQGKEGEGSKEKMEKM